MKVFISWSGEKSRLVAEALRYWLPKVIQAIQPWMSANDIEKGTRWRSDIASELEKTSIGIICLTPENLSSSWLHFEAGALSKQQQNTYVCTFLYGLEPTDVREPLAQFQNTKAQGADVKKLVQTINNALGDNKLPDSEINESFEVWWPKLEQRLNSIPASQTSPEPQRSDREILEEILGLMRSQAQARDIPAPGIRQVSNMITGKELAAADIKNLADHFRVAPADIRQATFDEDALIELLEILNKEKAQRRRRPPVVFSDKDLLDMSAAVKGGQNEDTDS